MDKFKMKDGRIVSVDFTDVNSLLSVSKDDWKEINEKIEEALKVVRSKIPQINFLRSMGALPNKTQYLAALDTIKSYEATEREIAEEKATLVEEELKELFGNFITEFKCKVETNFNSADFKIVIYPLEPMFDEDYSGSYDKDIKAIGNKHNIRVFMDSGIYSK
jgi:hypothetical protein